MDTRNSETTALRNMLVTATELSRSPNPVLQRGMPRVTAILHELLQLTDPTYLSLVPGDLRSHTDDTDRLNSKTSP
jgi:hypothetical protein